MRKILAPLILLILMTGCSSRPDAGIKISGESCITTNSYGNCSITFSNVQKDNTFYLEKIVLEPEETVFLEMDITIFSGEMQVGVINYEGDWVTYSVLPDQVLKISQWVVGDGSGTLPVQFNNLGNKPVENVQIHLKYTRQ